MNKKNKALVVILLLLVAAVIITFTAVLRPLLTENNTEEEPAVTQEGETIGALGKYQIYKQLERSEMKRIYVHNSFGEYAFVRDNNGEFVIEGMEDLSYNEKYLSVLISVVGNPLALAKVDSGSDRYDEYGITDSDIYWEITATNGKIYRMTVGHMTHTAGGYYVSYADREAVYVLGGDFSSVVDVAGGGTSLDVTVLRPIEFYVTPVLVAGIDSNDFYLMNNFTVFKDEEKFLSVKIVDKEDQVNPDAIVENILTYPAEYNTNDDIYYQILQKVSVLAGTETVDANATDADFEKYGLSNPRYMIVFDYNKINYAIIVSAALEDGSYYATSSFNPTVVVKVDGESLNFLEEELLYWVSPNPFAYSITSVEKISVTGKNTDLEFYLRHGTDSSNKATLTVDAINNITGKSRTIADADDVWNFRSAYRTMLYTQIEAAVPLTDEEIDALTADEKSCVLTFEYTLDSGTKRTLKFMQYSTRRTLLTVNGEGQFYVYLDRANKLISDFNKVWNGETVDSHAKN